MANAAVVFEDTFYADSASVVSSFATTLTNQTASLGNLGLALLTSTPSAMPSPASVPLLAVGIGGRALIRRRQTV